MNIKKFSIILALGVAANIILLNQALFAQSTNCTPIRHSFKAFTPVTTGSITFYGNNSYSYDGYLTTSPNKSQISSLTWLETYPLSTYQTKNAYRLYGYAAQSNDCGQTWSLLPDTVAPMKITGPVTQANNGVDHFASQLTNTNWLSQGFATNIQWDVYYGLNGRIYPIFFNGSNWSYQAMDSNNDIPNPVIGNPDLTAHDNFYSPAIVANGDSAGSIQLYFGGWRANPPASIPTCQGPSGVVYGQGYIEKDCSCSLSIAGGSYDSCTGDKIFMSTNQMSVSTKSNYLNYQVYRPTDGTYTSNGSDSTQFEPIIYASLLNTGCHITSPQTCPFPLIMTNDPTVVKFTTSSGIQREVMYFTGAVASTNPNNPNAMQNYTHTATSDDGGKTWYNLSILTKNPGVRFPGGLPFNAANGSVRAFLAKITDSIRSTQSIYLLSSPDTNNPEFNNTNNDIENGYGNLFLYKINKNNPSVVISSQVLNGSEYNLSQCSHSETACLSAAPYNPTFPETPASSLPLYGCSALGCMPVPSGLTAVAGNSNVALNWNTVSGATSYNIERSSTNGGPYTVIGTSTNNNYNDNSASNGSTYYYEVIGTNAGGVSPASSQASATLIPSIPSNFTANASNSNVELNWSASPGATVYYIARATLGGSWTWITTVTQGNTYTDAAVSHGMTYYYIIVAGNTAGVSGDSSMANATP